MTRRTSASIIAVFGFISLGVVGIGTSVVLAAETANPKPEQIIDHAVGPRVEEPETSTGVGRTSESALDVPPIDSEFTVAGDGETSLAWSLAAGAFALIFIAVGGHLWTKKQEAENSDHQDS